MSNGDQFRAKRWADALVLTAIAVGACAFFVAWGNQVRLILTWRAAYDGLQIQGDDCEYATGVWDDGTTPEAVLAKPHTFEKILVPFRRAPAKPKVNERGYLLTQCRFDLAPYAGQLFAALHLGRIHGPSWVALDGRIRYAQDDSGIVELPLEPAERHAGALVQMLSRPDKELKRVGPSTLMPVFATNDSAALDRVAHNIWADRVESAAFLQGYSLSLLVFFAVAWLLGIRYPDVGWMVVTATLLAAYNINGYTPVGTWTHLNDVIGATLRYALSLAMGAFLYSFLRLRHRQINLPLLFTAGTGLILALRLLLPEDIWSALGLGTWMSDVFAGLIFLVPGLAGLRVVRTLGGSRGFRARAVLLCAFVASVLFFVQVGIVSFTALLPGQFLLYALLTVFAGFLAADLVVFHAQYFVERTRREREEEEKGMLTTRLDLGRAVQSLLLPKAMAGEFSGFRYSYFYEPYQGMSGDWLAHWAGPDETHLILGDVVGKGPQAAISVTAIVAAINDAKLEGSTLKECIQRVNRNLLNLFDGHVMTTLTAVSLAKGRDAARIFNCGTAGWYHMQGEAGARRVLAPGSMLGAQADPEIGESEVQLARGDALFTFTDGVLDGARATAAFVRKTRGQKYGPDQQADLFNAAAEAGRGHVLDDDKAMIVVSRL